MSVPAMHTPSRHPMDRDTLHEGAGSLGFELGGGGIGRARSCSGGERESKMEIAQVDGCRRRVWRGKRREETHYYTSGPRSGTTAGGAHVEVPNCVGMRSGKDSPVREVGPESQQASVQKEEWKGGMGIGIGIGTWNLEMGGEIGNGGGWGDAEMEETLTWPPIHLVKEQSAASQRKGEFG
ncbi:hypothetical protein NEOLEDRAFT_1152438 [Neolentinus lepideus HHB14362 ss-1]|uniref:Uncharacterized protein n=1 Tax=Neolentinus lepideus HHB14362 ss-1 TaxID=1314782 RepID=A0A165MSH2_9AGAM|nr:hypothetical protein NEOLEDRAFT_1152438 [Neolentinus lepideus HHB14362 ss-1]